MVRHLGAAAVFYDIGANLGFFSLLAAHLSGLEEGRVYAFEAAPDNAEAIRVNAALNASPNVEVIAKAVSDRAGQRARCRWSTTRAGPSSPSTASTPSPSSVIDVELVAIDDLVGRGALPPPTLVKIDVEGAELAVLEGMRETIDAPPPGDHLRAARHPRRVREAMDGPATG